MGNGRLPAGQPQVRLRVRPGPRRPGRGRRHRGRWQRPGDRRDAERRGHRLGRGRPRGPHAPPPRPRRQLRRRARAGNGCRGVRRRGRPRRDLQPTTADRGARRRRGLRPPDHRDAGHTAGHISVLDQVAGVLVAGDALTGTGDGGVGGPSPRFTDDMATAHESVRTLATWEFNTAFFGHGEPVDSDASARVVDSPPRCSGRHRRNCGSAAVVCWIRARSRADPAHSWLPSSRFARGIEYASPPNPIPIKRVMNQRRASGIDGNA